MQLRSYQRAAIDSIYNYFITRPNPENPLIVAPTGSGKSVIIGAFIQEVLEKWPGQRLMMLTHVKELVEQNHEKIIGFWPAAPAGVYCAGLNKKQPNHPIVAGSIQSVYRRPFDFGWRDLLIIDECHLLSPNNVSMYQKFISELKQYNPRLKIIGFTATPYRLKSGHLCEGKGRLFDEVAYNISIERLLNDGYLSPLTTKSSATQANLQGVKTTAGEYNMKQAEEALDDDRLTEAALDEVERLAQDRKHWLFFCTGIAHAEHVRDHLVRRGHNCECITSNTPKDDRVNIIQRFKSGKLRCLTNANVLTTGFDAPNVDCLVLLRPTQSPGLYTQILGRGMRIAEGKKNCLVLDFAGNVERHGPVTCVTPPPSPKEKKERKSEVIPPSCIICPVCRSAWPLRTLLCEDCGHDFTPPEIISHETTATKADIMGSKRDGPVDDGWRDVTGVAYSLHQKPGKPQSVKVTYRCGLMEYNEYLCFEHGGWAQWKAEEWWKRRTTLKPAQTSSLNCIALVDFHEEIIQSKRIRVRKSGKFWEIVDHELQDRPIRTESAALHAETAYKAY